MLITQDNRNNFFNFKQNEAIQNVYKKSGPEKHYSIKSQIISLNKNWDLGYIEDTSFFYNVTKQAKHCFVNEGILIP